MSLFNYLQPQKIDDSVDDADDARFSEDRINLNEKLDEASLEKFWNNVVADLHEDPEWFTFDNN